MTQPNRRSYSDGIPNAASDYRLPPQLPPPWTDPRDAELYFEQDLTHFPHPLAMLDYDFAKHCVDHGMSMAVKRLSSPFRTEMRRFWTHVYTREVLYCPPQEVQEVWNTTTREAFAPMLADLERHWSNVWLPEIRAAQRSWSAFDLEGASDADLADHLARSLQLIRRVWEIHFEVVYSVGHAWNMYYETFMELFEGATRLEAMTPLEGLDNMTAEAGRAIWQLAELAQAVPAVAETVASSDPSEALARLRDTPGAEVFLTGLDDYLQAYGHRSTSINLSSKSLVEDPTPVVSQLRDALTNPGSDPRRHQDGRNRDREQAIERARLALEHYPGQFRKEFEHRLAQAQVAVQLKENHNFVIDYECTAAMRRLVMEVARRLVVTGSLERQEDVLHLSLEELQAAANALAKNVTGALDLSMLVAERAAEMERYAGVEVPTTLGTPPPKPPAEATEAPAPEPGTFVGVGMSAGVARGRVRVARSFDDAGALRPGEVLVATSTTQPWSPLFATAAALVTEAGGVLSHVGVIAREYRLPAVSGVAKAVDVLKDGMIVEVDGLAGVVRVISEG